jgi:hypothetical protein
MQNITFDQLPSAILEIDRKLDRLLNQLPFIKNPVKEDPLLTMEQLIDYLPEHPAKQTVYGWVNFRLIPYQKFGKRLYFRQSEIDAWQSNGRQFR